MAYQKETVAFVQRSAASTGLGAALGKLATRKGVSVIEIARITGASRPTIYRWFYGHGVSKAYEAAVTRLIKRLKKK